MSQQNSYAFENDEDQQSELKCQEQDYYEIEYKPQSLEINQSKDKGSQKDFKIKNNSRKIYHSTGVTPQNTNPYNQQIKQQLLLLSNNNNNNNQLQSSNSRLKLYQENGQSKLVPNSIKSIQLNKESDFFKQNIYLFEKERLFENLQKAKVTINTLTQENYQLKASIQKSDRQNKKIIDDLSSKIPGAKGVASNKPIFESSLTVSLRRQIKELQNERKQINQQLETLKRSVKVTRAQELEIENQELQIEVTRLKESLDLQTEQNKQIHQQNTAQPQRLKQLENEQIFGQKEIDELRSDNIQMANLLRNKDKILFNLEAENTNLKKQCNSQQNHLNQMKIIQKDRETEIGKLNQEIIRMKNSRNQYSTSSNNFFKQTNSPFSKNDHGRRIIKTSQQDIRIKHYGKQLSNNNQRTSNSKNSRNQSNKSRGNQREKQARVTQQDVITVKKELRAQFINKQTPFSQIEYIIIQESLEQKEKISIKELKNILVQEPFSIKSGFKIDQLARYLVEDQESAFVNYSPNNTASIDQIRQKFCDLIQDYEIISDKKQYQEFEEQLFEILSQQCVTLKRSLEQLSKDKVQVTCQQIETALQKQSINFNLDQEIIFWQILYNENAQQLDLVPIGLIFSSFNLDDIIKQSQKNHSSNSGNLKNKIHKRPNVDPVTKQKQIQQKQQEKIQLLQQQKEEEQEFKQKQLQNEQIQQQKIEEDEELQVQQEQQIEEQQKDAKKEKEKQIQKQQLEEEEKAQLKELEQQKEKDRIQRELQEKQKKEQEEYKKQLQIQKEKEKQDRIQQEEVNKQKEIQRQQELEKKKEIEKQQEIEKQRIAQKEKEEKQEKEEKERELHELQIQKQKQKEEKEEQNRKIQIQLENQKQIEQEQEKEKASQIKQLQEQEDLKQQQLEEKEENYEQEYEQDQDQEQEQEQEDDYNDEVFEEQNKIKDEEQNLNQNQNQNQNEEIEIENNINDNFINNESDKERRQSDQQINTQFSNQQKNDGENNNKSDIDYEQEDDDFQIEDEQNKNQIQIKNQDNSQNQEYEDDDEFKNNNNNIIDTNRNGENDIEHEKLSSFNESQKDNKENYAHTNEDIEEDLL